MRAYELTEAAQTGFQLYVDLDGVLVDFKKGVRDLLNTSSYETRDQWRVIHSMSYEDAENWWANLPWAPGGQELWAYVSKFHPIILSTPDDRPGFRDVCERGKNRWIQTHLNPQPAAVILTKDKWKHANKFSILIDDRQKVLVPWEEHGGAGIQHHMPDAKATIKELVTRFGFPRK